MRVRELANLGELHAGVWNTNDSLVNLSNVVDLPLHYYPDVNQTWDFVFTMAEYISCISCNATYFYHYL